MFEQFVAPDNVIALHFSGKLTDTDVEKYRALLDAGLATHKRLGVVIDFTGLSDMSADALVEGAQADLWFVTHLDRFGRCALVSDKEWPRAMLGMIGPLLPTIEMKAFASDRRDEATRWAAEPPAAAGEASPAFRILPTNRADVFAFEINGVMSAEEMPGLIAEFDTFLAGHEKVRLLNRMKHFGGIDPAIFMQGGLVSMKLAALQKVERYAIVGAPAWMRRIVDGLNPVFPDLEMRTFSPDQEEEAWAWLGAAPAG